MVLAQGSDHLQGLFQATAGGVIGHDLYQRFPSVFAIEAVLSACNAALAALIAHGWRQPIPRLSLGNRGTEWIGQKACHGWNWLQLVINRWLLFTHIEQGYLRKGCPPARSRKGVDRERLTLAHECRCSVAQRTSCMGLHSAFFQAMNSWLIKAVFCLCSYSCRPWARQHRCKVTARKMGSRSSGGHRLA